jgi:hypothetical protein
VRRTAAAAVLFLLTRIALLAAREPFFDEGFTLWMARLPLRDVLPALFHDSGPPLYYFLARVPSITVLRWVSMFFAAGAFVLVARKSVLAALLLAAYPPAALYAGDARAYALCGLFVAIGVIALDDEKPFPAAVAFVGAAYTHYYGVFFFPLLLLKRRRGVGPFALALLLFAPGFALALRQPREAIAWNSWHGFGAVNLSFAGFYPDSLLAPASAAMVVVALTLLGVAVARSWRFAPAVLIPLILAMATRTYFPLRFESVIAVPLVLWIAASLTAWGRSWRAVLAGSLIAVGLAVIALGVADHLRRPPDARALVIAAVPPGLPVVASGYAYLPAVLARGEGVRAFPEDQAVHPGWYRQISVDQATASASRLPAGEFVWVGDEVTAEFTALRRARRLSVIARDGYTLAVHVAPRS